MKTAKNIISQTLKHELYFSKRWEARLNSTRMADPLDSPNTCEIDYDKLSRS